MGNVPATTVYETIDVRRDARHKISIVSTEPSQKGKCDEQQMWVEIPLVFNELSNDPSVNVIVLTGKGRHFCSGIDVSSQETLFETLGDTESEPDGGRRGSTF